MDGCKPVRYWLLLLLSLNTLCGQILELQVALRRRRQSLLNNGLKNYERRAQSHNQTTEDDDEEEEHRQERRKEETRRRTRLEPFENVDKVVTNSFECLNCKLRRFRPRRRRHLRVRAARHAHAQEE